MESNFSNRRIILKAILGTGVSASIGGLVISGDVLAAAPIDPIIASGVLYSTQSIFELANQKRLKAKDVATHRLAMAYCFRALDNAATFPEIKANMLKSGMVSLTVSDFDRILPEIEKILQNNGIPVKSGALRSKHPKRTVPVGEVVSLLDKGATNLAQQCEKFWSGVESTLQAAESNVKKVQQPDVNATPEWCTAAYVSDILLAGAVALAYVACQELPSTTTCGAALSLFLALAASLAVTALYCS
jgi:hypothetical protein